MEKRINLQKVEPGAYKAMYALENYLQTSMLSKTHKELLKIRASQINGCAYCINLHTTDAIRNGESEHTARPERGGKNGAGRHADEHGK